jgi:hypothetical protein
MTSVSKKNYVALPEFEREFLIFSSTALFLIHVISQRKAGRRATLMLTKLYIDRGNFSTGTY